MAHRYEKKLDNRPSMLTEIYNDEANRASGFVYNQLKKPLNKRIRSNNLINGLMGGMALGIIVGALVGDTKSRVPAYDDKGRVTDYVFDANKLAQTVVVSLAIATVIGLMIAELRTRSDIKKNRSNIETMAKSLFDDYFNAALNSYTQLDKTCSELPLYPRTIYTRAAALVINTMPETELKRIRDFAKMELARITDGQPTMEYKRQDLHPSSTEIATVAKIISNYIDYNPSVKNAVLTKLSEIDSTVFAASKLNQKTR